MADIIVDPSNENVALVDGALAGSVRIAPAGTSMQELIAAPIIGYHIGYNVWEADRG